MLAGTWRLTLPQGAPPACRGRCGGVRRPIDVITRQQRPCTPVQLFRQRGWGARSGLQHHRQQHGEASQYELPLSGHDVPLTVQRRLSNECASLGSRDALAGPARSQHACPVKLNRELPGVHDHHIGKPGRWQPVLRGLQVVQQPAITLHKFDWTPGCSSNRETCGCWSARVSVVWMRAARSAAPPGAGCRLCCLLPAHLPRALPAHSAGLSGEGTTEQKFITLPDPRTGRHPTVLNTPIMLPRQPAPCLAAAPTCPNCRPAHPAAHPAAPPLAQASPPATCWQGAA